MKWIIFSTDGNERLRRLLESGVEHMGNITPVVIVKYSSEEAGAECVRIAHEYKAYWLAGGDTFRSNTLGAIESVRKDMTLDPMVLLTPDDVVFRAGVNLSMVWSALQKDIVGVNLALGMSSPCMVEKRELAVRGDQLFMWDLDDVQWFSLGTIYRTPELLGALCETEWNSLPELVSAVNESQLPFPGLKMACQQEPSLEPQGG